MEEIIEYLKERIESIKKYNETMNSASWGYEEGCIISGDDAQKIIDFYELYKSVGELNPFCLIPQWDKIPEQFQWVAVDEDGDECAYTTKPSYADDSMWGNAEYVFTGRKLDMRNIDWTKTLSKRPQ